MSFQVDKKGKVESEEVETVEVETKELDPVAKLLQLLDRSDKARGGASSIESLTNRSVKIDIDYYRLMKRYAFENQRKLKEVLDEAIDKYIRGKIDEFAKTVEPTVDMLSKTDEEKEKALEHQAQKIQNELEAIRKRKVK